MCCRPTEDRDDGIREAECEGGEGCRLAAGRLQGGQSVRQEACAPGSVAGSGVASRAKYTSEVKVSYNPPCAPPYHIGALHLHQVNPLYPFARSISHLQTISCVWT